MPTLTVNPGTTVREGEIATFVVTLSEPLAHEIWFRASTLKSSTASAARGDYDGFSDKVHHIPAGVTEYYILVQTHEVEDVGDGHEAVGLLVDEVSDASVSIADTGVGAGRGYVTILEEEGVSAGGDNQPDQGYENNGGSSVSFAVSDAVAANEGSGQQLRFEFEFYGEHNSYSNPVRVEFDIVNTRTGEVVDGGSRQLAIIDGYKDTTFNWTPPDDDVFTGEYTEYALVVTSMENTSGPTGTVAYGRVYDDELPDQDPEPEGSEGTPLSAAYLADYEQLFAEKETAAGTAEDFAAVIGADEELSIIGRTLDAFGLLSTGVKNAVTWFAGTQALAYEGEFTEYSVEMTENQINQGFRLQSSLDNIDVGQVTWTSSDVEQTDALGLKVGDLVDGRVVIAQPFNTRFADGHKWQVTQGMSDGTSSMRSHFTQDVAGNLGFHEVALDFVLSEQHLSTPGVNEFFYAQAPGTIVSYIDNIPDGPNGPGGLGNSVTIKLDQQAYLDGEWRDVYVTYSHAKAGSIESTLGSNWQGMTVDVGTPLGIVGNSGDSDGPHLDVGYSTEVYTNQPATTGDWSYGSNIGNVLHYVVENSDDRGEAEPRDVNGVAIPNVYILGFDVLQNGMPRGSYTEAQRVDVEWVGEEPFGQGGDYTVPDYEDGSSSGGGGTTTTPVIIEGTEGDNIIDGVAGDEIMYGYGGDDQLNGSPGDDVYHGGAGFDQVVYYGPDAYSDLFTFTDNGDGTITLQSDAFGSDTIDNEISGIWFDGEVEWLDWDSIVASLNSGGGGSTSPTIIEGDGNDNVIDGVAGDEIMYGYGGDDQLNGSPGDDVYHGGAGFDQVVYYGPDAYSDLFTFTDNGDGTITLQSDAFGSDTIDNEISGIWFDGEVKWMDWDAIVAETVTTSTAQTHHGDASDDHWLGAAGDDTYLGGGGFDQVDYQGPDSSFSNFTFIDNGDGTISSVSDAFGVDTYDAEIDGLWFNADVAWYTMASIRDSLEQSVQPTEGADDIPGTSGDDFIFALGGDDTMYGSAGNDVYHGGAGFDQIVFEGAGSSYDQFTFTDNGDGSVTSEHATFGTDIIHDDVEGVWMDEQIAWYQYVDLVA